MAGTAAKKKELPFLSGDAARDPKWTRKAWDLYQSDRLRLSRQGNEARLSGACPRCDHAITGGYPLAVTVDRVERSEGGRAAVGGSIGVLGGGGGSFADLLVPLPEKDVADELELLFECACSQAHGKRPEGVSPGCGVFFSLFVTV